MKTETHYKYALKLCERYSDEISPKERVMLVLGAIAPDISLTSYLKGFSVRPFFGHDWGNSRKYIKCCFERLDNGRMTAYGLGKLLHFLCDAFTFPHGGKYCGGLREHTLYEKRLNDVFFAEEAEMFKVLYSKDDKGNAFEKISVLHERYYLAEPSEKTDARFIKAVCEYTVERWSVVQSKAASALRLREARQSSRP